jgi:hypothetical protein
MISFAKISRINKVMWETLKSPRMIAILKLSAAVVGVVHAIDELRESPKSKQQIGFRFSQEEDKQD